MKHISSKNSQSTLTSVEPKDVQPNAVDLKLDRVFQIFDNTFEISNEHKIHRGTAEIDVKYDGYYELDPGTYEITFENIINMGDSEAGWVITRSTLNRNGCFLTSGLYDSGFCGEMSCVLHVTTGPIRIKRGTRIGQFLLFDAETLHLYDGSYGYDKHGNPKEDQKKYHNKE